MAKVLLETGDTYVAASAATIFGSTGSETVKVQDGVAVTLDQSVERVEFARASSAYTYKATTTGVQVLNGTTVVANVASGEKLAFTDGSASVASTFNATTGTVAFTLGGQSVTTTGNTIPTTALNTAASELSTVTTTTPTTTTPSLSIASASVVEGNSGTTNLNFTVTLSAASTSAVTVAYATTGGTATSGVDYTATSGTLTIAAGQTTGTITVPVIGDTIYEANETFTLTLSNPTNATVSTTAGTATGTITNDDTNALPVITIPTTTPSAFIASSTSITGISFTDADDNAGFTVTLQATGSSQLSFSNLTATSGNTVAAQNAAGTAVAVNGTSNLITLTGTKADVNSVLGYLKYSTNSTIPTSESLSIKVVDPNGGTTTSTLPINIGSSLTLTSSSDSLVGSAGDDLFSGTLANFGTGDTLVGGTGTDKLTLTAIGVGGASGTLPTLTTAATGIDVLDLTTNNAALTTDAVSFSAANFGSTLTTVNFTTQNGSSAADANDTLTAATVNTGTVFNIQNSAGGLTLSAINGTAGTTDAFTVNLAGGVTLGAITNTVVSANSVIDALTINSNGSSANTVSTFAPDTAIDIPITIGGSAALSLILPNKDFGVVNGANATGALTINASLVNAEAGTIKFAVTGGSGNDSITGGITSASLTGGAGADTIIGGIAADTITGGLGADSLTGGATGANTFVFATGDSPSTGRDTITDLKESDIIKFGTALTGLTNGATLTTSSSNSIYVDTTNNRLVVGSDQINIPSAIANAAFTYSYGADSVVGTADDYLTVGAAPFTATNDGLGLLTLTGKSTATVTVTLNDTTPSTVNGSSTLNSTNLSNVYKIDASKVTTSGILVNTGTVADSITGSPQADTIIGGSNTDTINGGAGADVINGGAGADTLTGGSGADTIAGGAGNDTIDVTSSTTDSDKVYLGVTINSAGTVASLAAITSGTSDTDTITGFTVGSGAGSDILGFGSTFTGGVAFGSGQFSALASNNAIASGDSTKILDISGASTTYSAASGINGLFGAFSAAGSQKAIALADSGTNEYIWYVDDSLDGDATTLTATDVVLIGIISGQTGTAWAAGNFTAGLA